MPHFAGPSRRHSVLADQGQNLGGGERDVGAGAVDRADPGLFQEIVVLRRDDAAAHDQDVAGVRVQGQTNGLVLKNNTVRDTRPATQRHQTTGVRVEKDAGALTIDGNMIDGEQPVKDDRTAAAAK